MITSSTEFREVRLERMSRQFGNYNALKDISLTVNRGEFISLLGPSGCGKSTALNCLAGLLPLSSGSLWLDDRRIDVLRPEERGFGMVFQNYALFPHMNVRRNVGFGLQMKNVPQSEMDARVDDALDVVRLRSQELKLPGQLSGGQQQRVAIARAVAVSPPIVLMDEPLSNLDAKLRLEMRAEIRRIHRAIGSATIYVTHDQDEALSLSDRIVVMREGEVRQIGTPHELYARPAHIDVAEFMGFRNALAGTVKRKYGLEVEVECDTGGTLRAMAVNAVEGGRAVVAIRPADLRPSLDGKISAAVTSLEYRGEAYFGTAQGAVNQELFFRTEDPIAVGETIKLDAPSLRSLAYRGTEEWKP
ncbi:ABC transporter ATP-binding protein [Rhizobium sp. BK376]|uniref:ABC transporter ATP-binding protein n=1 Tax=Rhizobium sp. BK376 TaxID=2512149 RepID=UPI0010454AFD|nr:ABC transporter ATP-binding protein [Rhizobium sp. BK376]TCR79507.1 carbohydrate ABC transporter ATP-binding protein (CUT1 family) [Rhizobium sp. BK376]